MSNMKAPSLIEGLRFLEKVVSCDRPIPFQEILESSTMSRSSVNRLLNVLVECGYLKGNIRSGYLIGIRFAAMQNAYLHNAADIEIIHSWLIDVADATETSLQYGIYDNNSVDIIVIDKAEAMGSVRVVGHGTSVINYANRNGIGKAILPFLPESDKEKIIKQIDMTQITKNTLLPNTIAFDNELKEVKELGYAIEREESAYGRFRIALPVFNLQGGIHGVIASCWATSIFQEEKASALLKELKQLKKYITKLLFKKEGEK